MLAVKGMNVHSHKEVLKCFFLMMLCLHGQIKGMVNCEGTWL